MDKKIIAIHLLGESTPRYISHYEHKNSDGPVMLMSHDRKHARQFDPSTALTVQIAIREAIANYIINRTPRLFGVFESATGVLIEDAFPATQRLFTLKAIVRRERPSLQTVEFINRVDEWLKQWTIANNYKAVLSLDEESILRYWRDEFVRDFNSAIGKSVLVGGTLTDNFTFEYVDVPVKLDDPFWMNYAPRMRHLCDIRDEVKESEHA